MTFEAGDILAFYGRDLISHLIRSWTWGPSHVAMVCRYENRPLRVESTTLSSDPCVITGQKTRGVQAHWPHDRVTRYPGRVDVYRLSTFWQLAPDESALLTRALLAWVHNRLPYDLAGAAISGTSLVKRSRWFPTDLDRLFCSELCAAALMRLCRLPLGVPGRYTPAGLVRALRRQATYQSPLRIHA